MADPPIRSNAREDPANDTGIPRWVKILGIIALVVILLLGVMLVSGPGGHGPGRHTP